MIGTIVELNAHIDDLISGNRTGLHGFLDTFFDLRNIFLRYRAADDGVLEFESFSRLARVYLDFDMTVLAFAA